jgi:3-dehydroquinate synthase
MTPSSRSGGSPGPSGPSGPTDDVDAGFDIPFEHRLRFTTGVFDPANATLRDTLAAVSTSTGRCIVCIDRGFLDAWPDLPDRIHAYARTCPDLMRIDGEVCIVPGGEDGKNGWDAYTKVVGAIDAAGLCRHSFVIAIGGGAMLDVAGFAAATAHRGVGLVRFPTTTLAQGDAALGVKNGINAFGKKNFIGTFAVPWAVINDDRFLRTLDDRDWRAGLSEAVKVALLKDARFFRRIAAAASHLRSRDEHAALPIIRRAAVLHFDHIVCGGDPFEAKTARPLDFGHWSAHKLEQRSSFRLRHGEAVSIGVALDALYSAEVGLLARDEAGQVLDCLTAIGLPLYDDLLTDHAALLDGLEEFREHLGGRLTITLLEAIGRPIDVHEIDAARMVDAVGRLAEHASECPARRRA